MTAKRGWLGLNESMIESAWQQYLQTRSREDRNRLVEHYIPLVPYAVNRFVRRLPPHLRNTEDDLHQLGSIGLIDAVEKFDPSRGVKFEAYSMNRIIGQMRDGLRAQDWVPRSVRERHRAVMEATDELERLMGEAPTEAEVAVYMGIEPGDVSRARQEVDLANHASLDSQVASVDGLVMLGDLQPTVDPTDTNLEFEEMKEIVAHRLAGLPERLRVIVALTFFYDMTPTEIGRELGVTESRVCQLQHRAYVSLAA